jgi:hypothetical protein
LFTLFSLTGGLVIAAEMAGVTTTLLKMLEFCASCLRKVAPSAWCEVTVIIDVFEQGLAVNCGG